ncbi:beta-1,3-glucan-binding protein 1-like isoform X3 [Thrips palmi]|uniref:Beta-1,3-glucan-binding protein 1-like isoform X3 n=1 Tax=Thrips palmi TaxID=161013 RepID=A0A6P8YYX4_THRPL|nr:beta-1,3-glucan-binding protein 1-like isoform X3 [Thrips palmi]
MPPRAVTERPAAPRRRAAPGVNTSLLACCACFPTCLLLFLASASVVTVAAQDVDVPVPTFEAFHPKGLRVSIPDIDGLEIFAFHGNVNKPLHNLEAGEMSVDVTAKKAGRWEYFNENRRLKAGDVINYWVWIQVDRKGYQRLGLSHRITELVPLGVDSQSNEPPPAARPGRPTGPTHTCELSATHVNGRPACKGEVVFEENWNSLDRRKWSHEVKISGSPDFEFCIYAQHPENTFVKNGWLHLKASLTNDKYGDDFVRKGNLQLEGCTAGPLNSESCSREAMFSYILPPVVASRLTTKNSFSFKYGKVEVRARLPRGDWMYPEVWLQPLREEYGAGLASGRIHLAMARGNTKLQGPAPGRQDISGRELAVGVLAGGKGTGSADARKKFFTKRNDVGHWGADFHNYSLLWTPDTLAFSVDGVELGVARPEEVGGLLRGQDNEGDDPWSHGSKIAPFDKEFYISLGLAVGGIHAFPDGCRSGNHDKPWKNTAAKAMLSFWNAREVWHSTWNGQQAELLVESVRVTALNN